MSALEDLAKLQYRIHFLDVKDADAIVIACRDNAFKKWSIALVDAGNVSDSKKIKDFIWDKYNTKTIDLAIVSHPDRDHKGGFFGLLEDKEITIKEFWWKNPSYAITDDDIVKMKRRDSKIDACERIFNHPSDSSRNLLREARKKCEYCYNVHVGGKSEKFHLTVLGPSEDYYRGAALSIVQNFAELGPDSDLAVYDEYAETDEDSARSILMNS